MGIWIMPNHLKRRSETDQCFEVQEARAEYYRAVQLGQLGADSIQAPRGIFVQRTQAAALHASMLRLRGNVAAERLWLVNNLQHLGNIEMRRSAFSDVTPPQ